MTYLDVWFYFEKHWYSSNDGWHLLNRNMWDGGGCWNGKWRYKSDARRTALQIKPVVHCCTPKGVRDGLYMSLNFLFSCMSSRTFSIKAFRGAFLRDPAHSEDKVLWRNVVVCTTCMNKKSFTWDVHTYETLLFTEVFENLPAQGNKGFWIGFDIPGRGIVSKRTAFRIFKWYATSDLLCILQWSGICPKLLMVFCNTPFEIPGCLNYE